MSEFAAELGFVLPTGRRSIAKYGDGSKYGMYDFTDGTVCHVIDDPLSDQNMVAVDSHLGTPPPAELDFNRFAEYTTHKALLQLENYTQ